VETKLRMAGIKLLKSDEVKDFVSVALFQTSISITLMKKVMDIVYIRIVSLHVSLSELVILERAPKISFRSNTYDYTHSFNPDKIDKINISMIQVLIQGQIDNFIRLYLLANPK
jgi:hypothetical protein